MTPGLFLEEDIPTVLICPVVQDRADPLLVLGRVPRDLARGAGVRAGGELVETTLGQRLNRHAAPRRTLRELVEGSTQCYATIPAMERGQTPTVSLSRPPREKSR